MIVPIFLLASLYLVGFGISIIYILKPDFKRTLLTSAVVVGGAALIIGVMVALDQGYAVWGAFFVACAGLCLYSFFVSFAMLVAGIVHRSGLWIGAASVGAIICLSLFLLLRGVADNG